MKHFCMLALTGILLSDCTPTSKLVSFNADNPVVAHRGAWKAKQLPENSVASLKQAIALGCYGSEFDVRMTADDTLVINHDPAFHGMEIEKVNYQSLLAYQLSNGEKIPTLYEYIQAGLHNNSHTKLIIEIKPSEISKERGKLIASRVYELVKKMNALSGAEFISFDYGILKTLVALDATVITQYLDGDHSPADLHRDGIKGADYHFSVYDAHPDWIDIAKEKSVFLNAWTVNDEALIAALWDKGVKYVTTNEPEQALRLFKERKK